MINKINELLESYLFYEMGSPDSSVLDFSFERPEKKWSESLDQTTVNIFLLDIDENRELRRHEWERRYEGEKIKSSKPPVMLDLYYMLTIYTKPSDPEKEHELLGTLLRALYRFDAQTKSDLGFTPELEQVAKNISLELFPKNYIDDRLGLQLWNAIDQYAKPLITVRITLPLELHIEKGGGIVREKDISIDPLRQSLCAISGCIVSEEEGASMPVKNAEVEILENGRRLQMRLSDERGRFALMRLPQMPLTLVVKADGYRKKIVEISNIAEMSKSPLTVVLEKMPT